MKKYIYSILVIVISTCIITAGCFAYVAFYAGYDASSFTLPETYELAYFDDFDTLDSVWDTVKWSGARRGGYWDGDTVSTKNGELVISTERKDDGYHTGYAEWDKMRTTYGYYEIRCRSDYARGVWSAVWLISDDVDNLDKKAQDGSEIDIVEIAAKNYVQNAVHYDGYGIHHRSAGKMLLVDDLYDGYHTYGLDWKHNEISFYYDNQLTWRITNRDRICQVPVRMILSCEINGRVADGTPVADGSAWVAVGKISEGELPFSFAVDYVKLYDNGELVISEI